MRNQSRKAKDDMDGKRDKTGFTLIELLVVIGILMVLAAVVMPAVKGLGKSNDLSQAGNLVRAELSSARSIAVSQHRGGGVVFFEEGGRGIGGQFYAKPVNTGQTAMQIFVEDYNQAQYSPSAGATVYVQYSSSRQYLPSGIKLAALSDIGAGVITGTPEVGVGLARAIVFDADGNMVTRGGLWTPTLGPPLAGAYPWAYGDWNFANVTTGVTVAASSPGFLLYNMDDFANHSKAMSDALWLSRNADVILVNANTGLLIDVKH